MNENIKKIYNQFQDIYNHIDSELVQNNQYKIDALLLNMNPSDVLDLVSNYAPKGFETLKSNEEMLNYFIGYLFKKKESYDNLSISNEKLGQLISKSGPGRQQHNKEESLYYNETDKEEYLNNILNRLIDCVNLYYSLYYDNDIEIELGDGTRLALQFLESNLLHILGITKSQVETNRELRRALNIPDWKERLSSMEILERIIKDIQTNKDILCLQMQNNVRRVERYATSGKIVETQLNDNTSSELLPYDKIDLKTRAFMNSGPYNGVSVISGINNGKYFVNRDIKQVRISKADFNTLEKNSVEINIGNGKKIRINTGDYIFNGYVKRDENIRTLMASQVGTSKNVIPQTDGTKTSNIQDYKKMFNNQTPIPVVGVDNPDGTTLVFSKEQQEEMFLSMYYEFGKVMNFDLYIDILKSFTDELENDLKEKSITQTESGYIVATEQKNVRR